MDYNFTVFVGNLPFTMKQEGLRAIFADCGTINYIRLIKDP